MSDSPFVIGVTGPIACGKSTVLSELRALGAMTIDADTVYHSLIEPGSALNRALADRFGSEILTSIGEIDRRRLGAIVFNDAEALTDLDAITHPVVSAEIRRRTRQSDSPVVAIDAVKLIESGSYRNCDSVWLVVCDREQQIERLMRRNQIDRETAVARVAAHQAVPENHEAVDLVIDNRGSIEQTRAQVQKAFAQTRLAEQVPESREIPE